MAETLGSKPDKGRPHARAQSEAFADLLGDDDATPGINGREHGLTILSAPLRFTDDSGPIPGLLMSDWRTPHLLRCDVSALSVDLYAQEAHNEQMARKTERFAVRLTPEQDALIRRAAEVEGTDLTNFTVTATLAHARDVLADRRLFALDDAAWREFMAVLERPASPNPSLEQLFAESSVFDPEA